MKRTSGAKNRCLLPKFNNIFRKKGKVAPDLAPAAFFQVWVAQLEIKHCGTLISSYEWPFCMQIFAHFQLHGCLRPYEEPKLDRHTQDVDEQWRCRAE